MAEPKNEQNSPLYDDIGNAAKIRLLVFQKSGGSKEIRLSMQTFFVDDCPPYIALSYTWEPRYPLQDVKLNGHDFQVGKNLCEFLKARIQEDAFDGGAWLSFEKTLTSLNPAHWGLQHRQRYIGEQSLWKFFWIDQFSVNQQNISERGHQVKLMASIYSHAAFVLIWLGTTIFGYQEKSAQSTIPEPPEAPFIGDWWSSTFETRQKSREHKSRLAKQGIPLQMIAASSYWSRLWIVQEVTLAKEIVIYQRGRNNLWAAHTFFASAWHDHNQINIIMRLRVSSPERSMLDLLIQTFRHQRCADPRDSVFGLLSLVMNEDNQRYTPVTADYSKSPQDLYIEVLQAVQFSARLHLWRDWIDFKSILAQCLQLSQSDIPGFTPLFQREEKEILPKYGLSDSEHDATLGERARRSVWIIDFVGELEAKSRELDLITRMKVSK